MRRVNKLKVEVTRPKAVCDFCLEKGNVEGKNYRLVSAHHKYRFLNICSRCLAKAERAFKKK